MQQHVLMVVLRRVPQVVDLQNAHLVSIAQVFIVLLEVILLSQVAVNVTHSLYR